ncbi:MAG: hypothetical protein PVH57_08200, partial [Syntrophobacterales bacterium]
MKRFQMSLRTKVVLSLTFLMASAMLLIGMVMLKVSQRDLVQAKIDQGLLLKTSVERLLNTTLSLGSDRIELAKSNSLLAGFQAGAPETMAVWKIIVTDRAGQVVYSTYRKQTGGNKPLAGLQRVMRLGVENISFTPNQGSFWKQLPE